MNWAFKVWPGAINRARSGQVASLVDLVVSFALFFKRSESPNSDTLLGAHLLLISPSSSIGDRGWCIMMIEGVKDCAVAPRFDSVWELMFCKVLLTRSH